MFFVEERNTTSIEDKWVKQPGLSIDSRQLANYNVKGKTKQNFSIKNTNNTEVLKATISQLV